MVPAKTEFPVEIEDRCLAYAEDDDYAVTSSLLKQAAFRIKELKAELQSSEQQRIAIAGLVPHIIQKQEDTESRALFFESLVKNIREDLLESVLTRNEALFSLVHSINLALAFYDDDRPK